MVLKRKKKEPYPIIDLMIKNLSRSWRFQLITQIPIK